MPSPALLLFQQPFGFNAILGLIGLSGILMRNTLILIGQIHSNEADGLDTYHAIVGATVQRQDPLFSPRLRRCQLYSAHAFRLLGLHGLCADRRNGDWDDFDPGVSALRFTPSGSASVCPLVSPDRAYRPDCVPAYQPRTMAKTRGATMEASDSMMYFGVSMPSLPR